MIHRRRELLRGKELSFDLENRPLAYWYPGETTSQITAFGWKWKHEEVAHTLVLRNTGKLEDDEGVEYPYGVGLQRFVEVLTSADLVYGHNIRRHDLPMIQAHLFRRKMELLPALNTSDTLKDCVRVGGMSRSLENLSKRLGFKDDKKHMSVVDWEDANELLADGVAEARDRVATDVLLQEQLRDELINCGYLKPPRMWKG